MNAAAPLVFRPGVLTLTGAAAFTRGTVTEARSAEQVNGVLKALDVPIGALFSTFFHGVFTPRNTSQASNGEQARPRAFTM